MKHKNAHIHLNDEKKTTKKKKKRCTEMKERIISLNETFNIRISVNYFVKKSVLWMYVELSVERLFFFSLFYSTLSRSACSLAVFSGFCQVNGNAVIVRDLR